MKHQNVNTLSVRNNYMERLLYILGCLFILCLIFSSAIIAYSTDKEVTVTITNKENIVSNNDSKYLIFTNNGVYQNSDTMWYWKWDSSDFYNQIEIGKEYTFRVYGFRIPFLSMYKNIIEIN